MSQLRAALPYDENQAWDLNEVMSIVVVNRATELKKL